MDGRSPWEHIGGLLLLAALVLCLYGEWLLVAVSGGVGALCIWLGWRAYQKREVGGHPDADR